MSWPREELQPFRQAVGGAKKWGYRIMQDWKAARNAPSQNANVKVNTYMKLR